MKRVLAFRDVLRTFAKKLRFPHYCLIFFLLIALLLRIDAARSPNIVHPDEIFQTQEPAHRLAYGYGVVTWEWREGIRSWVFPAFLAGVMRATTWLGRGSSGYVWGIAIVLSLISLTTVWFGFSWAKRASGVDAAIIAAGACATWHGLVDFAPCALTEVVAVHALLPGLYLAYTEIDSGKASGCFWRHSSAGSPCRYGSNWLLRSPLQLYISATRIGERDFSRSPRGSFYQF